MWRNQNAWSVTILDHQTMSITYFGEATTKQDLTMKALFLNIRQKKNQGNRDGLKLAFKSQK